MFSLICARINDWVTNREAGDLTRRRAHYDVTVMVITLSTKQFANLWESGLHSSVSTGHHRYLKDKNACRWLIEFVMYIMGMMLHNDSMVYLPLLTLQWRHNGRDSLSKHQPYDCFLNHLFRHRWKKTPKLCVTRKMFPFHDVIMKIPRLLIPVGTLCITRTLCTQFVSQVHFISGMIHWISFCWP